MIEAARLNSVKPFADNRLTGLLAAFVLIAATVPLFLIWVFFDDSLLDLRLNFRLLPWIGITALVLLTPTFYLFYKKKFDLFHPLVHAAWAYWFPSIVGGGIFIATDLINPLQLGLLADPETDLIWTCIYVMLGYAGLTLGFYLPIGRRAGEYASRKLPAWDWQPNQVLLPATVFLSLGLFFYINSFLAGVVGFSLTDKSDAFGSLYYTLSFLTLEAGFLMAMYVFKSPTFKVEHLFAFGAILLLLISRLSLGGNRGSMVSIVILLAIAFTYSGRRLTPTAGVVFTVIGVLAVFGGMIYGTAFRNQKLNEDRIGVDQQIEMVERTLDTISSQNTEKVLGDGFMSLAERIDGVSSIGVVVSNYERLAPYEASYGLENNILKDLGFSFIPRFLWNDKPPTSDPRAFSDLYYNFNGNSYSITPVGDLLRNYGPIGVLLGMAVIGIMLRFAYALLIENQKITIGRAAAYFLFLVTISYEGFYSTIIIYGWRILAIAFITFIIAESLFMKKNNRQTVYRWKS